MFPERSRREHYKGKPFWFRLWFRLRSTSTKKGKKELRRKMVSADKEILGLPNLEDFADLHREEIRLIFIVP